MTSTSTATVEVQLDTIVSRPQYSHIQIEGSSNETASAVVEEHALAQPIEEQPTSIDRQLALKLISAGFSFFLAGVNDGSLGTLISYFRQTYNIGFSSTTIM